jgi:hypothetical protein
VDSALLPRLCHRRVTVKLAEQVLELTIPEKDKWQARIFGLQFPEGSGMTEHNHTNV